MLSPRRFDPAKENPEFLTPSEVWLGALIVATQVALAWTGGSERSGLLPWVLGLSLAGLLLVALRARETGSLHWKYLIPALLWSVFVAIALANPSHTRAEQLGWVQRSDWIRWLPATTDCSHTFDAVQLWLPALLIGGLAAALLGTPRVVRTVWGVIALNGCLIAVSGAFFYFAGSTQVLGMIEPPDRSYFFATFFYKNHWAAFGAVSTIASFALALRATRAALACDPAAMGRLCLFSVSGLLTAITLPLPGSRAGAVLAAILIGSFMVSIGSQVFRRDSAPPKAPRRALLAGALVLLIVLAFGVHAYAPRARVDFARTEAQWEKSRDGSAFDVRILVSRDTWRMAQARPWFGWGPGCFEVGFPLYHGNYLRDPSGRIRVRFDRAHNDWLQLLAEGGFLGGALLIAPAIWAGTLAWRRAERAGRWAVGGCALIATYAWIDFPFHNPAILVSWVVLLTTAHRLRTASPAAG